MNKVNVSFVNGYLCHRCGAPMIPVPVTRRIYEGTKEYERYKIARLRITSGDLELSGYDYHCPACGNDTTGYDQEHIHLMQKKKGSPVLTQYELAEKVEQMKTRRHVLRLVKRYAWIILVLAAILLRHLLYR